MNKYRLVEYQMSDGSTRYGIEKKGWFGWKVVKITYYGIRVKYVHDKRIAESRLKDLNETHIHAVSKKEV